LGKSWIIPTFATAIHTGCRCRGAATNIGGYAGGVSVFEIYVVSQLGQIIQPGIKVVGGASGIIYPGLLRIRVAVPVGREYRCIARRRRAVGPRATLLGACRRQIKIVTRIDPYTGLAVREEDNIVFLATVLDGTAAIQIFLNRSSVHMSQGSTRGIATQSRNGGFQRVGIGTKAIQQNSTIGAGFITKTVKANTHAGSVILHYLAGGLLGGLQTSQGLRQSGAIALAGNGACATSI